jgi:outer membrane protein assembly factor BamD (BamD/ComL family)
MRASRTRADGHRLLAAACAAYLASGCQTMDNWFHSTKGDGPGSMVLKDGKFQADVTQAKGAEELNAAQEIYRADNKIEEAQKAFAKIADNTKNSPLIAEEARFYEAECLYKQDMLPKACDTYSKMLNDFPSGAYRDQAVRRMFDIANFWLEDTRLEMAEYREKREGKRTFVMPAVFHTEKKKPLLDEEGRAMQALQQVHLNDITGPLADKSLFLAGGVKFYREDYKEADHYFSQLVEHHPNSPLAAQAVELAIISKHMSTGGPEYDGRKVAEARILVDSALRNYPELARDKAGFLERQLGSISYQQAQKDYKIAEFYRRTGHPGSAYFYYEIVRRRYPGTKFADLATDRMAKLREEAEQSGGKSMSVIDQAIADVEALFKKKPATEPTASANGAEGPPLLPAPTPVPGNMPRSLPNDIGPRN